MAKFSLIDVLKIVRFFKDRKITRLIKRANELSKITGYRYIVLRIGGRVKLFKKSDLKHLLKSRYFLKGKAQRYFKKGVTIEEIEKFSIYITPQFPIYSKHDLKKLLKQDKSHE